MRTNIPIRRNYYLPAPPRTDRKENSQTTQRLYFLSRESKKVLVVAFKACKAGKCKGGAKRFFESINDNKVTFSTIFREKLRGIIFADFRTDPNLVDFKLVHRVHAAGVTIEVQDLVQPVVFYLQLVNGAIGLISALCAARRPISTSRCMFEMVLVSCSATFYRRLPNN